MAVVLNTDVLAPCERAEAVEAAMRYARVPAALTHDPDADAVQGGRCTTGTKPCTTSPSGHPGRS